MDGKVDQKEVKVERKPEKKKRRMRWPQRAPKLYHSPFLSYPIDVQTW